MYTPNIMLVLYEEYITAPKLLFFGGGGDREVV